MKTKIYEIHVKQEETEESGYSFIVKEAHSVREAITIAIAKQLFRTTKDIEEIAAIVCLSDVPASEGTENEESYTHVLQGKEYAEYLELKERDTYAQVIWGVNDSDSLLCPACKSVLAGMDEIPYFYTVDNFCPRCGKRLIRKQREELA